jgi:hypothetical protein
MNTGEHQYIFLLYKSSQGDVNPVSLSESSKRKQFALKQFEEEHQLQLVATLSFTVIG